MSLGDALGGIAGSVGAAQAWDMTQQNRDQQAYDLDQSNQLLKGANPNLTAYTTGQSALGRIGDQATRGDQLAALKQLQGIYASGGMDAQSQADIANANAQANQVASAQRGAIQNSAAQRGLSNSGIALAGQRSAAQAAGNTAAQAGTNAAAAGENRAQSALGQAAGLAGQIQNQDYTQASNAANANDAIAKFNAQQQTNAQQGTFNNQLNKANAYYTNQGQQGQDAQQYMDYYTGQAKAVGAGLGGIGDTGLAAAATFGKF